MIHGLAAQEWERADGSLPSFQIRDRGLLEATLAEPFTTFDGRPLYPTVTMKGACLFRGLVKDHPLVDGNKRLAVTAMTVFLQINGRDTTYSNDQLYRYAMRVAKQAGNYPLRLIERWLRDNSVAVERSLVGSLIMDLFAMWQDPDWVMRVMEWDEPAP